MDTLDHKITKDQDYKLQQAVKTLKKEIESKVYEAKQDLLVHVNEDLVSELRHELTRLITDKVKEVTKA